MSKFDIFTDAPGLLRSESLNITMRFDRTSPTTGRVSWNIPTPSAGCTAETQAYCGMVITLDTKPAAAGKGPVDTQIYSSDPTADTNLFAGDTIDTAIVIGAFYQDRTTTFFDVTGLKANTPYYVSGFPVDCQLRYFVQGVHAYSTEFKNRGSDGTSGTQVVVLNSSAPAMGVNGTDTTGLVIGDPYSFKIQIGLLPRPNRPIDPVDCAPTVPTYTITIDGADAQSYDDLVAAINNEFALLVGAPQGPTPPNTGGYYWNNQQRKLFQWNGSQHVEIPVLFETTQPNTVTTASHWYNTTTGVISSWNGVAWVAVPLIELGTDPSIPLADQSYWYDGTNAYIWNGTTWCLVQTYNQSSNPGLANGVPGGSFWYDDVNSVLYKWNAVLELWSATTAVQSSIDPNALPSGFNWYNNVSGQLFTYNIPMVGWNGETNVSVSEAAPLTPAPGKYWYNPAEMELFQRDPLNTMWVQKDVIVFPFDPTSRTSCDVWWDVTADQLYVWNVVGSVWAPVTSFFQQSTDPSSVPTLPEGVAWYNNGVLSVWTDGCFVVVDYTASATDPSQSIQIDSVWHNTTTDQWFVRQFSGWVQIDPIGSPTDPTMLTAGTFWFNPSTAGLQIWNGAAWMSITYATAPYTPATGSVWYDTTTAILKEWNGIAYVPTQTIATVELDCNGNLLFTDPRVGSLSFIGITDVSLFSSLAVSFNIHDMKPGTDGVSSTPSYDEIGVGTDGTIALRKSLMNDIRYELGYPTINVELTPEQLDYAISRALGTFRQRSSLAYKRGFFFMAIKANEQKFVLSNKISGMNKIVDILGVYRMTGSFLSSAHGAGVYGQIVLQHLYNMGTFDLLSYHIMAEYTKLMEMLFAARLTFTWNEQDRVLFIMNRFSLSEKMVAIEATVERTEQDLLSDRYTQPWIRKYASAIAKGMLAEIRGKFASLPGAGGSVTLNAGELRQASITEMQECIADIESYVVDRPEEYGIGTTFTFG